MELPDQHLTLFETVNELITSAKQRIASTANHELTLLYWRVGKSIKEVVLQNERASYGKAVVADLAQRLTQQYGKGWSEQQLRHCLYSAEVFSEEQILSTVWRELSWSHMKTIMYLDDPLKREFYSEMGRLERWSVRLLNERIDSMLYERTAISKKPDKLIQQELKALSQEDTITPDLIFRDPYLLDFLGLKDTFSEKDLESAILADLQRFITELGSDFAFLARQKRITVDQTDYYLDLLFYHRSLRRLVVIELKLGKFKPEHKGQMELYLRWLDQHERKPQEESPIGLILCSAGNTEHIELLMLEGSSIKVAQYLTELPKKELLQTRLHRVIALAKQRHKNNSPEAPPP